MPETQTGIFLSYSRTDSTFVDRLEADLQARSFYVWVDRRKVEGGQDWPEELEKAIQRCSVLLVIISPEAVASKYVRREYHYAQQLGKHVIPLEYRPVELGPMNLNDIQWIKFKNYDQGLTELLRALSYIEVKVVSVPESVSTQEQPPFDLFPEIKDLPVLVPPRPAPPLPDPELMSLYREGREAKTERNLERAVAFWQQVLGRDPQFLGGILAVEMNELMLEVLPIRIEILRKRAEEAHNAGEWGQEIGSWEALLGLAACRREVNANSSGMVDCVHEKNIQNRGL